jgi:hypothetical protein
MVRDDPSQAEPRFLGWEHYGKMVDSGAPFARPFQENDHLLDKIDNSINAGAMDLFLVPGAPKGRGGSQIRVLSGVT